MASKKRASSDQVASQLCDGFAEKRLTTKQTAWLKGTWDSEVRAAGFIPSQREATGECACHGFTAWHLTVLSNKAGILRYQ